MTYKDDQNQKGQGQKPYNPNQKQPYGEDKGDRGQGGQGGGQGGQGGQGGRR